MPGRIGGKILSIVKVVRRTQNLSATTAALTLGSITTLFFLPIGLSARITMLVPSLLFFSRKIFVYVYSRNATERLELEEQFVSLGSDPEHLRESLAGRSDTWSRSAIVRSVRGADYRPHMDAAPANVLTKKLERHLRHAFSEMVLPRPGIDHVLLSIWIASWVYFAILHPSPSVIAATVLIMTGMALFTGVIWIELNFNLAVRDQRSRMYGLYWDLAEWLIDQLSDIKDRVAGNSLYCRKEHFRDSPWFTT